MKKAQIKKSVSALAMAAVIAVSLFGYGCGAKPASTSSDAGVSGDFTGTAKGFGGDVSVTLTLTDGAITMGPAVGALLGGVFGAVSFYDAITGASAMTGALFQVSPLNTFILCVGMRVLMGLCCGLIFKGLQKLDKSRTWSYILSAMTAPALNTLFFMGYIVLAFYGCDYVQNLVSVKGAANPFMFVVLLVGVQGVAEFLVSGILGGIVARAVAKFLK